jgi:hypothetical protein
MRLGRSWTETDLGSPRLLRNGRLGKSLAAAPTDLINPRFRNGKMKRSTTEPNLNGSRLRNGKEFHGILADGAVYRRSGGRKVAFNHMLETSEEVEEEEEDQEDMDLDGDEDEDETNEATPVAKRTRRKTQPSSAEEAGDNEPTPVARRTRASERTTRPRVAKLRARNKLVDGSTDEDEEVEGEDMDYQSSEGEVEEEEHNDGRVLRNGKVLTSAEESAEGSSVTSGNEGDEESEEEIEEDVDMATATRKGLLRLRRDELVKMCSERELEGEGTKKDLVDALLLWVRSILDNCS